MIIKAKKKIDPRDEDKRKIKLFALFPRRCEKDHYHWLEYVEVLQIWKRGEGWVAVISEGNQAFHPEFPCICNKEKKKQKDLEIGKTYMFVLSNSNPFQKTFYVKIIDICGGYVQYIHVDENGNNCAVPTKWDINIESFNHCYKRKNNDS